MTSAPRSRRLASPIAKHRGTAGFLGSTGWRVASGAWLGAASMVSGVAVAAEPSAGTANPPARLSGGLEACAQLRVDSERLLCYDRYVAPQVKGSADPNAGPAGPAASPVGAGTIGGPTTAAPSAAARNAANPTALPDDGSYLDEFWELSAERKRGTFNFTGYRPNYFLPFHDTSGLNLHPSSPAPGHSGQQAPFRNIESKLQLSIRTKLAEGLFLPDADLWFAYTQQSLWQIYSADISRPFRSTDHEPEIFYVVPTPFELPFGIKTKMVGLGLAHQSNGQSLPFSRSWNRWYLMAGLERGDLALTARFNTRIRESDGNNDNPDLTSYRGRTELLGVWSPGASTLSALWRTNFTAKRGSLQIDWTLPVNRKDPKGLRWYAQVFTGYAETLIDYNYNQSSVGLGVTLFGW
jgi:phospholipase A1